MIILKNFLVTFDVTRALAEEGAYTKNVPGLSKALVKLMVC